MILTGATRWCCRPAASPLVMARLAAIPHLDVVRIHTRIPVSSPARIDAAMIAALAPARLAVWVVLHSNHAAELTPDACAALARLVGAGILLCRNQCFCAASMPIPTRWPICSAR